jgi:hypothetical protein
LLAQVAEPRWTYAIGGPHGLFERAKKEETVLKLRRIAQFSPAKDHGLRPRAGSAGRCLGMALGVVVALFTTGLASAAPAVAAGGTAPADLLNLPALQSTATAAQAASLEDLEQRAVENTLTDHGLPSTDFDAAQTWGRDAAEGELWALLVQAINTPAAQQTTDQANAVAWLSKLVVQRDVQAADDAGLERGRADFVHGLVRKLRDGHASPSLLGRLNS